MNTVVRSTFLRAGVLLGLAVPAVATSPVAAQADSPAAGPDAVSRLVREALARPDDPAAWTGLAEALPELAVTRDADPVSVFEASRLADSLATAPVEEATTATADTSAGLTAWVTGLTTSDAAALAPWFLVVILLVAGPLLSRIRGRPSAAPADDEGAPATGNQPGKGPVPGVSPRLWTVTTLADNGLPPAEIARRTGMAQDAVQVLLGLRDAPVPSALRNRSTGATRPPSLTERAAGISTLRQELARDARRLEGGRLTYGPERNA